jgi:putative two-component system response regulator
MRIDRRVLAVDDDATNLSIIHETIGDTCDLRTVTDGESALRLARDFRPNVVLLDIMMPLMDGYEVCRRIRNDPIARFCSIILVSAKSEVADRLKGYEAGANDYLTKPFIDEELEAKVQVAFNTKTFAEFSTFRNQNERMCGLHGETLAVISQLRDVEDGTHLTNVRSVSHILAGELRQGLYKSQIDDEFLDSLYVASILHDVGKIGLPDRLLRKTSELSEEEWEQMKGHTIVGQRILNHLAHQHSKAGVYEMAAAVARWHHECFDGSGYPDGIHGQCIPLAARIVKVADTFDTTLAHSEATLLESVVRVRDELVQARGCAFDPIIVDALCQTFEEIAEVYQDDMFVETLQLRP